MKTAREILAMGGWRASVKMAGIPEDTKANEKEVRTDLSLQIQRVHKGLGGKITGKVPPPILMESAGRQRLAVLTLDSSETFTTRSKGTMSGNLVRLICHPIIQQPGMMPFVREGN